MNRNTSGPPFVSDPSVITFRDFVIGEQMEVDFHLINSGFQRDTFHFEYFDQEYQTLFEIQNSPPGPVAPGNSAPLKLIFRPKYNSKINCKAHFLAQSGPFEVEIECLPRKVSIQIEPFDELNIGNVTLGEEKEVPVIIRNSGALPATWTVSLEKCIDEEGYLTPEEAENIITFSVRHSIINGYSSSTLRVNFKPEATCNVRLTLRFKFTSPNGHFDPFTYDLALVCVGADIPIFLEHEEIDFGVCFYGEMYRQNLVAINRSAQSHTFIIECPPDLENFFEFMPKTGFIQSESTLQITIKVRMNSKFKQLFPQYEKTAHIPLTMTIVNQVLPVHFAMNITPSPTRLIFDPPYLDFGTITTTEKKQISLHITSMLEVPVDFGFVKLPPGITIEPFDGYGAILPGETIEVYVNFISTLAKKHEFKVKIITLQGATFTLKGEANVIVSPVTLSSTLIEFETTSLGEQSSYNLFVTNNKQTPIEYQFSNAADMFFDPCVGTVPANSSAPVSIVFKPTVPVKAPIIEIQETEASPKASSKKAEKKHSKSSSKRKAAAVEVISEPEMMTIDPEFTYRLYTENVKCFWRGGKESGRHHLQLKAAAVLPTIFVTGVSINKREKKSEELIDLELRNIDFGVVALGQYMDAIIDIRSMSRHPLTLAFEVDCGSFEVLTPTSTILPLNQLKMRLRFYPRGAFVFNSKVTIQCVQRPNLRITLNARGEGAAPSIKLSPEVIDFGHVMIGNPITRTVSLVNDATFELQYIYRLEPNSHMHHVNSNSQEAFAVLNRSEWLAPEQEGEASIQFTPDHDSLDYETVLVVSAGEDGQTREVPVHACAWPYPMFVMGGIEEQRERTAFDHNALDEPYFRSSLICELIYPGTTSVTTVQIGAAIQSDEAKKGNADFSFDNVSIPGFTITPNKGNIEPGTTVSVTIEYQPLSTSLLQVGQWVVGETSINLKCGDFSKKLPVKLKCLINMQQNADLFGSSMRSSKQSAKGKRRR